MFFSGAYQGTRTRNAPEESSLLVHPERYATGIFRALPRRFASGSGMCPAAKGDAAR
jgi:hypothetical protein